MKRNDFYIVAAVLLIAFIWLMVRQFVFSGTGGEVSVSQDGKDIAVYPLTEDIDIELSSEDGGSNTLVIRNGEAYISEADCPDGLCMEQKAASKKGESIICLPHKLVIEVTGGTDNDVDAVVGQR